MKIEENFPLYQGEHTMHHGVMCPEHCPNTAAHLRKLRHLLHNLTDFLFRFFLTISQQQAAVHWGKNSSGNTDARSHLYSRFSLEILEEKK